MSTAEEQFQQSIEDDNIENMFLVFGVGEEHYAVEIAFVTEIVGMQKIIEVPDVPHYIKGVINLRGQVIPVVDIRARFHLNEEAYTDRTVIIVLEMNGSQTGLVVDSVKEVLEIADNAIDPPPSSHSGKNKQVIKGMGKLEEFVAIILNIEQLLESSDNIELDLENHPE